MDNPASYTHPALQQRPTPTIQSILAYGVPSSSLSPSPKHLQRHHPQNLAAIPMPGAAPGPPAEPIASQCVSADGQQSTISSEADFGKDDNTHPSGGESGTRRRNINSSKRAAQNRAAQRAFRLRRERYVAGLEEKARSYDRLEAAYMEMQRENFQLRSRLNKIHSENSVLRNHLAAGSTHASSPSPPNAATASFMPTQAPTVAPDRVGTHHAALRQPPPMHHRPEPEYQYSTHQQSHAYHEHYPRYHQRHHDHSPAPYQDSPQRPHGAFHRQSAVQRQLSPAGAQQPPYHHNPVHRRHYPIRREHSLPQNAADPRSPVLAERHLMRPEPIPPPSAAFASPIERVSSPGGMWDGGMAAANRAQSPEVGPRPYNPQMSSETASSSSSAAAAHMLPSVREITMSIGNMLPTSPQHPDHGLPAQPRFHAEGIGSYRKSGCSETDGRPW